MRVRSGVFLCAVLAAVSLCLSSAAGAADSRVLLDFYFEPGCEECHRVDTEILPVLAANYGDTYSLQRWDLGIDTNYVRLASEMERLGRDDNAHVFMVVDRIHMLAGADTIAAELFDRVDERLAFGMAGDSADTGAHSPEPESTDEFASRRLQGFTIAGVILGGLIDGINPCAIATLVFLVSVLTMAKVQGRRLLLVGAAFCFASFLTYTAIGFGLLRALHMLSAFHSIRTVVETVLVVLLVGLALFSFRDAFRFSRSHKASDVSIQLPDRIKRLTHRLMRVGLKNHAQVASAFVIGAAVTALESVCTGQVYVPTLALVVKSGSNVGRGTAYLVLYNLMFILPLVTVFLLTYHGMKLARLMEWSRENVVMSKVLLGAFFVLMAIAMLLLR